MAYMDVAPAGPANGHTVMIFHGNNFAGFYFGNIVEALGREGFRVIVPDQIGYGRSSKPIIPYNFNDMARNTHAILQRLADEPDEVALAGCRPPHVKAGRDEQLLAWGASRGPPAPHHFLGSAEGGGRERTFG